MKSNSRASRQPLLIALALTVLGGGAAYWIIGLPPLLGAEDAAIGFRYARNLALGHGIVFNPGGEHVEGFTSFLWLLVSAGVFRLFGEAALEVVLFVLSVALTVGVLATLLSLLFDRLDSALGRWVAVSWLAAQAGFYFWSALSLMDVALWTAGLTAYLFVLVSRLEGRPLPRGSLVAVVAALVLTRPESMLIVPGAIVAAGLVYGLTPQVRRVGMIAAGTLGVSLGALTAFRLWYFGYPLPNTYYVKVSPDLAFRLREGWAYVADYLTAHPVSWLAVVAVVGYGVAYIMRATGVGVADDLSSEPEDRSLRPAIFTSAFIVLGFASVVYGGGDHYQGHRFLQAYLPMASIPLAAGVVALQSIAARRFERGGLAAGVLALLAVAVPIYGEWTTYGSHGLRRQAIDVGLQGRFVGQTLNDVFAGSEPPEVGLWMVGGAGYAYTGSVKDLLGLNWIAMGTAPGDRKGPRDHAAFNADVFWSDPPEVMIPEPEAVLRAVRCVRDVYGSAMLGVLTTDRFRSEFSPVRLRRDDSEPIIAYAHADWLRTGPPYVESLGWSYCDGG